MITIGVAIILASLALGFAILFAIGMADGAQPHGWDLWSQLWPAYLGLALGVLFIAAKWLP